MNLPEAFIEDLKPYLPAAELEEFLHALTETEASTCIRWNVRKKEDVNPDIDNNGKRSATPVIGWCPEGRYLQERPLFTLDPRLHAGAYYVQEASSQFITHVLRSLLPQDQSVTMLDLCAAPGGKSTAALSVLPEGSVLVSNEIDHRRARILSENVTKWGMANVIVTGNAPHDFTPLTHLFDVVLTDVPCSGEGMFRKDDGAVNDWSTAKVEGCVNLQRQILRDIWPTLKPGGLLIYGTCTFNVHEDEEQLHYICEELGATPMAIPVNEAWHIHPPLMGDIPCYRFMPHYTHGEGLFMAALRKDDDELPAATHRNDKRGGKKKGKAQAAKPLPDQKRMMAEARNWVKCEGDVEITAEGVLRFIPTSLKPLHEQLTSQGLYLLQSGIELGTVKGRDITPAHALAMSLERHPDAFPCVELDRETALHYLRREAITLSPGAPHGYVLVTHQALPIGFVKNLGNRSNNLYPQEWRIRMNT